jgi:hypothetical protein
MIQRYKTPTNPIKSVYTKEYKTLIREAHEKWSEWLDSSGRTEGPTVTTNGDPFVEFYLHMFKGPRR